MISANGVEYKNLPEQVQYLTERAAEFAVELDRVSASVDSVAGDVAALQTSYTALAEDVRVAKININSLFTNVGTAFSEIANIKNGTTHLFETITDKNGNPRFVEGNITMNTIAGVTQTYGKWSLSGTHMMIVISGNVDTNIQVHGTLSDFKIPQWISNKIKNVAAYLIDRKEVTWFGNNLSNQTSVISLIRVDGRNLRLSTSDLTTTAIRHFRVQFDLLIDDE